MKTAQPEPRRRSALLRRAVIATSSAGAEESRSGPRKRAVRWNEPSLLRMTPLATSAAHGRKSARLWLRRRYSVRFIIARTSRAHVLRVTQVPAHDVDKGGVALRRPDRGDVPDQPDEAAGDPQTEAEPDRRGERPVHNRHGTGRAAQEDRLGERAVDGGVEARDGAVLLHHTVTPPPNWKKVRKKLDAAKAMLRPNTIWMSRRKPPLVSPKASVRPVTMMMITDTTLATGPWMLSRIWLSGCSHGM